MPKTPNYSFERLQRERTQQAKAQQRSDIRAEKAAKRKGVQADAAPDSATDAAGQPEKNG